MANETDKNLYQEVGRSYEAAALILNELAAELVTIEQKYGRESTLLKKKLGQLQALRSVFDNSLKYINHLRDLNDRMYTEVITRELERQKRETGLSFKQLAELIGWDPERWGKVDHIDDVIFNAKTKLGILDEESSLQSLIESLRGKK